MRIYWEIIKNNYKSNFAYKFNFIISIFSNIIVFFIQFNIWRAIYGDMSIISSSVGEINLNEMITYLIISTCITIIINTNILGTIGSSIQSGQLATELTRPLYLFLNSIGNNIFQILFQMIPALVIILLFFDIILPSTINFYLFLIALIYSYLINYLLRYLLGSLAYWYMSVWHFDLLITEVISVFAGAYIPIWFFPNVLLELSKLLPFQLIYYFPLSIYLGKCQIKDIFYFYALQLFWIAVLFFLSNLLYKRGIKKLVIQGG